MTSKYSNIQDISLSMQIFLATDNYDHNPDPNTISATSLLKPLRQLILSSRVKQDDATVDLSQMIASRIGSAIHDGIERAWTTNYRKAMEVLGYPNNIISRVVINKPIEDVLETDFPVYFEQRSSKAINGYNITGKFDFISEGAVEDFKSTSVWTYINSTNNKKYIEQGSIYRWLNPKLITSDQMAIQYIFTDWSAAQARSNVNYPQSRFKRKTFTLMSEADTERFIVNKLNLIKQYWNSAESDIPECTSEDLWRSEPVFKYYKNPEKLLRSTKNFETKQDAYTHAALIGSGIVLEKPGQVTACKYCSGFSECKQKDSLIATGDLVL